MMKYILSALCVLLCCAGAQTLDSSRFPALIPGVDLCKLFTLQELDELTGLGLVEVWDYEPDVPGYFFGDMFSDMPTIGKLNDYEPYDRQGTMDVTFAGRQCKYLNNVGGRVEFTLHETAEDFLATYGSETIEEVNPNVFRTSLACHVNPFPMKIWITIWVRLSAEMPLLEGRETSCLIATEGSVTARAQYVESQLLGE